MQPESISIDVLCDAGEVETTVILDGGRHRTFVLPTIPLEEPRSNDPMYLIGLVVRAVKIAFDMEA